MAIWNQKYETMSRDELEKLQGERLVKQVKRVYENVEPYRKKMDEAGVKPEDIRSIEDLPLLPFTTKEDLMDNYPFGLLAVPREEVTEIHASSGTTGKQKVSSYTENDVELWAEIAARSLSAMGVTKDSIVQTAYGFGLFTGGFGAHYGARKIGAMAVPMSSGNSKRQIQIMKDFGSTFLACTPSYALSLSETLRDMGYTKDDIKLEGGAFGAEPWTENMRRELEDKLGIHAYDIYGLSEVLGPGVSYECQEQAGMHINEDHFIAEVIDPDTGEVVPDGSMGELVFTCITKEAMPLIRYRTRDICTLNKGMCRCGRTLARMSKPMGRSDDMLIIRGVNVFPSQIEGVLMNTKGVAPHYQIIVDRINNKDTLEVQIEVASHAFTDQISDLEALAKRISADLLSALGIRANVKLVEPKSIARSEGKAVRVIDRRRLD
ncbi:MAG TPA: phenylacetate--CoA ligase [Firmicutes bacterium]|nr:phenylacetate--CoA ligase [Bacillota bacterium]